jgi:hypothetical protein
MLQSKTRDIQSGKSIIEIKEQHVEVTPQGRAREITCDLTKAEALEKVIRVFH